METRLKDQSLSQKNSDNTTDTHRHRTPIVKGQRRKRPAWSDWNFETNPLASKTEPCAYCGKEAVPLAHTNSGDVVGRKYFCSNEHGKLYLYDKQKRT